MTIWSAPIRARAPSSATTPIRRSIFRAATSGTYYFSIEAFDDDDHGQPTLVRRLSAQRQRRPAGDAAAADPGGCRGAAAAARSWNHLDADLRLPDARQPISGQLRGSPDNGFTPFTATQQAATPAAAADRRHRHAADLRSSSRPIPAQADMRYAMSNEADVAYAYYPTNGGPSSIGGTAWFNHTNFNTPDAGQLCLDGHPPRDRPRARPQARPRIPAGDQRRPRQRRIFGDDLPLLSRARTSPAAAATPTRPGAIRRR